MCHLKMWPFVTGVMSLLCPPQIVFEAVTSGQRGLLAIKDIVVKGHQCSKFSFFFFFSCHHKGIPSKSHCPFHDTSPTPVLLLRSRPPRQTGRSSKWALHRYHIVNLPPPWSLKIYDHKVSVVSFQRHAKKWERNIPEKNKTNTTPPTRAPLHFWRMFAGALPLVDSHVYLTLAEHKRRLGKIMST